MDSEPFGSNVDYGIGLVMVKAPDRGQAAVFLDGVRVATIDTHSTGKVNRTVVWRSAVAGNSNHIEKVVDLATAGHPRIDIDAFVLLKKVPGHALDPSVF